MARVILDTNAVSEFTRPDPNPGFLAWAAKTPFSDLAVTTITLIELRYGLLRKPAGRRREALAERVEKALRPFEILVLDARAAKAAGALLAEREAAGRRMQLADAAIAGIALTQDAVLVTRDRDYDGAPLRLLHPWSESASDG